MILKKFTKLCLILLYYVFIWTKQSAVWVAIKLKFKYSSIGNNKKKQNKSQLSSLDFINIHQHCWHATKSALILRESNKILQLCCINYAVKILFALNYSASSNRGKKVYIQILSWFLSSYGGSLWSDKLNLHNLCLYF